MPYARLTDPETSHEAAASVGNISETQKVILYLLENPKTDTSLYRSYLWQWKAGNAPYASESGVRSRRADLVKLGLVKDTQAREVLDSGRKSIVWGLNEQG